MNWYSVEIDEYDHFYRTWEDVKHGMFIIQLNDNLEKWLNENITSNYDVNCDDIYSNSNYHFAIIEFTNEEDAMAFKLRWL